MIQQQDYFDNNNLSQNIEIEMDVNNYNNNNKNDENNNNNDENNSNNNNNNNNENNNNYNENNNNNNNNNSDHKNNSIFNLPQLPQHLSSYLPQQKKHQLSQQFQKHFQLFHTFQTLSQHLSSLKLILSTSAKLTSVYQTDPNICKLFHHQIPHLLQKIKHFFQQSQKQQQNSSYCLSKNNKFLSQLISIQQQYEQLRKKDEKLSYDQMDQTGRLEEICQIVNVKKQTIKNMKEKIYKKKQEINEFIQQIGNENIEQQVNNINQQINEFIKQINSQYCHNNHNNEDNQDIIDKPQQLTQQQLQLLTCLNLQPFQACLSQSFNTIKSQFHQLFQQMVLRHGIYFNQSLHLTQLSKSSQNLSSNQQQHKHLTSHINKLQSSLMKKQQQKQSIVKQKLSERQSQLNNNKYNQSMKFIVATRVLFDKLGKDMLNQQEYQKFKSQIQMKKNTAMRMKFDEI